MQKFDIATGKHRNSTTWRNEQVTWEQIRVKCSKTHRTAESYKEFLTAPKARQSEIKDVGAFVGAYLVNGSRSLSNVQHRQLLTLDADYALSDFWEGFLSFNLIYGCCGLIYSTHTHSPEKPRLRLVIPLDRAVDVIEHEAIARRVCQALGIEQFDHTTYDANRLMYWPSTARDGEFVFESVGGDPLCADDLLATYRNFRDTSEWPMADSEKKAIRAGIKQMGDPLEKKGIVGAFCRTYFPIEEAIPLLLDEEYDTTDKEDRFTYRQGSTAAGLIIYDNKFAHSHHGTDPVSGKSCNIFDLVRIHRFGHLDDLDESKPMNRRKSYLEMEEYALADKAVKKLIGEERMAEAGMAFDIVEDTDWLQELERDRRGNLVTSNHNIELIMLNDPALKGAFGQNLFARKKAVFKKLPWDEKFTGVRDWSDDDLKALRVYLGKNPYNLQRSPKTEDVMSIVKLKNAVHPVRQYLDGLSWDGKRRLDSLFIDFLGAEDSVYTRMVTRKMMVAAVARIYEPGCKFEYVLTLVGPEGTGKSAILKKLGGDWFTDTFSFSMLTGGNGVRAFEQIRGFWFVEIGEMGGYKKAEAEAAKNFIASSSDTFRPSHGEELVTYLRECVLAGTSNNYGFLTAAFGNRRFWPVATNVSEPVLDVWDDLDEAYRAQLFAEAKYLYEKGEKLFLPDEIERQAREMQSKFEEKDEWTEIITRWLEEPVSLVDDEFSESNKLRTKVCVADIWVLALGGSIKDINNGNTKRIHAIMRTLPEWEMLKSKVHFENYSVKQTGYVRKKVQPDFGLSDN